MVEFLLAVLIVMLAIRWFVIRDRHERANLQQIAQLTQRVWRLEQALGPPPAPEPAPAEPVRPVAVPPAPVHVPPEPPGPTPGARLRALLGNQEWEALVGGSLLNKIGALVLVVGIALFLACSFASMTPAGRTLTAFLTSGALLVPGVWLERKQTYRVFSRGLIGAGWAGLYSTAYAMYALPAARIVEDPFVGSLLLVAVAAGMIAHSLRYRVQTVTGIAYFTAFAALAALLLVLGLQLESYLAATLGFLHIWIVNFPSLETVGGVSARLVSAGAVAAALYGAEFLAARPSRARAFFSALATLLVAGLLWKEVSGSVLTVAWGVQGLLLLGAGFPARERPLRLAGLALLLYCISKLFIYDLRRLETVYRILSFVALGVILLGVSWIYTRFRETIRRGFFQG